MSNILAKSVSIFWGHRWYRILVSAGGNGSDNLEQVFESRLKRIGNVVALLDKWEDPIYLKRTGDGQNIATTIQQNQFEIEATLQPN